MDIILSCMTWVPIIWGQLRGVFIPKNKTCIPPSDTFFLGDSFVCSNTVSENVSCCSSPCLDDNLHEGNLLLLPDDIIINIFSRLTAECAFQCLGVCRTLCAILSSPSFATLHRDRATPSLVFQCFEVYKESNLQSRDIVLHFIDGCKEILASKRKIRTKNEYEPIVFGSYNGLLLFENRTIDDTVCFIWNPITKEQVTVTTPNIRYNVCGLFFHTPTEEYRILYLFWEIYHPQYLILSLRTKLTRRIADCNEVPCISSPPIILNGALHWMVSEEFSVGRSRMSSSCSKSILSFKIKSEDFVTMPHPGDNCCSRERHEQMQLLEMDGHLCLCDVISSTGLHLWVLEDYEKQSWVKTHTVDIKSLIARHFLRDGKERDGKELMDLRAVCIHNDQLLLEWNMYKLFYYHLKRNSFRRVDRDFMKGSFTAVVLHTNGIAPLNTDGLLSLENLC